MKDISEYDQLPTSSLETVLREAGSTEEFIKKIVAAYNSHEILLKAAKQALVELERYQEGTSERYALRNAIAKAEGK